MRKFIYILTLSILTIVFLGLIFSSYKSVKQYFDGKKAEIPVSTPTPLGLPSFYKTYSLDEYNKALDQKQVVLLYFTANWSEDCKNQDLKNEELIRSLDSQGVAGFYVHVLDSQSTNETMQLAKKFDVEKENTFIIVDKNGVLYFRHTGLLEENILKQKLMEAGDRT